MGFASVLFVSWLGCAGPTFSSALAAAPKLGAERGHSRAAPASSDLGAERGRSEQQAATINIILLFGKAIIYVF